MSKNANTYDKGQAVRCECTFDVDGTLIDPTSVTAKVKAPDGTETTPTVTNPSTGVYRAEVTADQSGTWYYRFESTGGVSAEERFFLVSESQF